MSITKAATQKNVKYILPPLQIIHYFFETKKIFCHLSPNYKRWLGAFTRPKILIWDYETRTIFVFSFRCQSEALIVHLNRRVSDTVPLKYISMLVACFDCTYQHKLSSGTISVPTYLLISRTLGCQAGLVDKKDKKPNTSTHRIVKNPYSTPKNRICSFQVCTSKHITFSC